MHPFICTAQTAGKSRTASLIALARFKASGSSTCPRSSGKRSKSFIRRGVALAFSSRFGFAVLMSSLVRRFIHFYPDKMTGAPYLHYCGRSIRLPSVGSGDISRNARADTSEWKHDGPRPSQSLCWPRDTVEAGFAVPDLSLASAGADDPAAPPRHGRDRPLT